MSWVKLNQLLHTPFTPLILAVVNKHHDCSLLSFDDIAPLTITYSIPTRFTIYDSDHAWNDTDTMAIPIPVLATLPIPFAILLLLLACYHLTPLLQLIPHLTPRLSKLANLIPHPGRRNLPREFFNLPPRPEDGDETRLSVAGCLGVRGKLMLFLILQTAISLAAGWVYMFEQGVGSGAGAMLALSIIPLPASIFTLAIFTAFSYQTSQRHYANGYGWNAGKVLAGGGITHDTIWPRILPFSLIPTMSVTIISAILPSSSHLTVLVSSAGLVGSLMVMSLVGRLRARRQHRSGAIRLRSSSPGLVSGEGSAVQELREKEIDDWVSSPGRSISPPLDLRADGKVTDHAESLSSRTPPRSPHPVLILGLDPAIRMDPLHPGDLPRPLLLLPFLNGNGPLEILSLPQARQLRGNDPDHLVHHLPSKICLKSNPELRNHPQLLCTL